MPTKIVAPAPGSKRVGNGQGDRPAREFGWPVIIGYAIDAWCVRP